MENVTLKTVIGQLEELFQIFNKRFYNGEILTPVIAVNSDSSNSCYGWCTTWKAWQQEGTEGHYEINMCAEHLNRPFDEICVTLLHEMVHIWNLQLGIKDTSRGNTYHNAKFKTMAEDKGLSITRHAKYGWTISELSMEGQDFVDTITDMKFNLYRTPIAKSESTSKSKSSSRKYICPECGQSVRATKEIKLLCGECSDEDELVMMELEGDDE